MKSLIDLKNVKKLINITLESVDVSKIKQDAGIVRNKFTNEEDYGYSDFRIKVAKNDAIQDVFNVIMKNVHNDISFIKTDEVIFNNNAVKFSQEYYQIFQDNKEKMYKNRDNYQVLNDKIEAYLKDALFVLKEDTSSESLNDFYKKNNQSVVAISESFNKHTETLLKSIERDEIGKETIEAVVQNADVKKDEPLNDIKR